MYCILGRAWARRLVAWRVTLIYTYNWDIIHIQASYIIHKENYWSLEWSDGLEYHCNCNRQVGRRFTVVMADGCYSSHRSMPLILCSLASLSLVSQAFTLACAYAWPPSLRLTPQPSFHLVMHSFFVVWHCATRRFVRAELSVIARQSEQHT